MNKCTTKQKAYIWTLLGRNRLTFDQAIPFVPTIKDHTKIETIHDMTFIEAHAMINWLLDKLMKERYAHV